MPLLRIAAQAPFLPALAVRHPAALSPERALGELSLHASPETRSPDGAHGIALHRAGAARDRPVGPFDYPRPLRRFAGPRPAQRYDLALARYRPGGGSALWLAAHVSADTFYFKSLMQTLVARASATVGGAVLHSGLVESDGRGLLLVGGSGSGKSSLAAFALLAGARFVSDDMVLIARDGERFAGRAFRAYSLLRPATFEALPDGLARLTVKVTAEEGTKHLLTRDRLGERAVERAPIDALLLPRVDAAAPATGDGFSLVDVPKSAAVARLLGCLDTSPFLPGLEAERAAAAASIVEVARTLPCFEVAMSSRFLTEPGACVRRLLGEVLRRIGAR